MAYKQKEYREKMKRDGSGMEKKKYILLDVGGTEIKGSVSDRNGVRTKIRKFPAQAQKSTEKILDNFAKICRELMRELGWRFRVRLIMKMESAGCRD